MNTQEDIEAGKHITGVRRRRGGLTREDPEEEEGWNELTAHRENPAERLRTAYGIPTQRQTRRGEKQAASPCLQTRILPFPQDPDIHPNSTIQRDRNTTDVSVSA